MPELNYRNITIEQIETMEKELAHQAREFLISLGGMDNGYSTWAIGKLRTGLEIRFNRTDITLDEMSTKSTVLRYKLLNYIESMVGKEGWFALTQRKYDFELYRISHEYGCGDILCRLTKGG